jgi:hypothetical protein
MVSLERYREFLETKYPNQGLGIVARFFLRSFLTVRILENK